MYPYGLNYLTMFIKKPRLTLFILGAAMLTTIATTGCAGKDDKKEPAKDSATVKPAAPDTSAKKMDTASTRPIVTPN